MKFTHLPLALLCAILFSPAYGDVFRCQQADGTTVFSFVPCVVKPEPKEEVLQTLSFAEIPELEPTGTTLNSRVEVLEQNLDQLREQREAEIANAPFAASNPDAQSEVKRQIRASYQTRIDETINELINLRYQMRHSEAGAD